MTVSLKFCLIICGVTCFVGFWFLALAGSPRETGGALGIIIAGVAVACAVVVGAELDL